MRSLNSGVLAKILCLFLVGAGCTHIRHIDIKNQDELARLEDASDKGSARLRVAGESIKIDSLVFRGDTIRYYQEGSSGYKEIRVDSIQHFEYRNHLSGVFDGIGRGFVTFGIAGIVIGGVSEAIDADDDYFELTTKVHRAMLLNGFAFGVAGGVLGIPVGALVGSKMKYLPPPDSLSKKEN